MLLVPEATRVVSKHSPNLGTLNECPPFLLALSLPLRTGIQNGLQFCFRIESLPWHLNKEEIFRNGHI